MATLLLVDDDRVMLEVLSEFFSGEYVCHTAANAEEALRLLGSDDYDAVVTDLSMPGLSGEDLLGFVKAHRPGIPVIFISGSIDEERTGRLLRKGAFDYLKKPFPLEELARRVSLALAHARPRRTGA
jgi:DNA-binding NtrC family response regulator